MRDVNYCVTCEAVIIGHKV